MPHAHFTEDGVLVIDGLSPYRVAAIHYFWAEDAEHAIEQFRIVTQDEDHEPNQVELIHGEVDW